MEISFYRTEKYAEFFYIHILIKTKKKKKSFNVSILFFDF